MSRGAVPDVADLIAEYREAWEARVRGGTPAIRAGRRILQTCAPLRDRLTRRWLDFCEVYGTAEAMRLQPDLLRAMRGEAPNGNRKL